MKDTDSIRTPHPVATEEEYNNLKDQIETGGDFDEFDEVVFSAEVGTVQGPVKTQFGYRLLEEMAPRE